MIQIFSENAASSNLFFPKVCPEICGRHLEPPSGSFFLRSICYEFFPAVRRTGKFFVVRCSVNRFQKWLHISYEPFPVLGSEINEFNVLIAVSLNRTSEKYGASDHSNAWTVTYDVLRISWVYSAYY